MEPLRTRDGLQLHLQHWPAPGPARGTVQLVHGLGEHIGRYDALARELNAAGWHVAGHDHRGHGRSEGLRGVLRSPQALLDDLALVVDRLRGEGAHVLLGHSLGGVVAARFVAGALATPAPAWSRAVDGLVLSSPAFDIGLSAFDRYGMGWLAPMLPDMQLANGLQAAWISRDAEVVRAYRDDALVHDRVSPRLVRFLLQEGAAVLQLAPAWRTPTLLLWAGADRCVRPAGSAAFAAAAPREVVTAQAFPALFHEIFNEPERQQVLDHLTLWLQRF